MRISYSAWRRPASTSLPRTCPTRTVPFEGARQAPALVRDVLVEQTDVLHPITIWRKHHNRFRQPSKPTIDRQPESEITENPVETPENIESEPSVDDAKPSVSAPERSRLSKIERGGDIYSIYTTNQSRANP
jgi:hypothetical protein